MARLTLNGRATFDIRTAGSAGVVITGALSTTPASGTVVVNVTSAPTWVTGTTYNLISYGSFGGLLSDFTQGTISGLGARQTSTLALNGNNVALSIGGDTVTWTGAASTAWTTNTVGTPFNWKTTTGLADTEFLTSDDVIFNDSAAGAGTVNVDISTASVSPNSVTFNNATRAYNLTGTGGVIASGTVTKNGAATVTLNTANTYNGATTVNAGTLILTGANTGTGVTNVKGGSLVLAGGSNRLLSTGSVVLGDAGTTGKVVLGDASAASNQTLAALTTTGSGGSVVGGNASTNSILTLSSSSAVTYAGTLGGAGTNENNLALIKSGSGTLTLSGASTYSGGTTLANGIINANSSTAFGSGTLEFNGAGVRVVLANGVNLANAITIGTNAGVASNGLLQVAGTDTATLSGPISITAGALGGGHFATLNTGVVNVTGAITSSVIVSQRTGTVVYSGGGTGYTLMNLTGTGRLGANNGLSTAASVTIGASAAGVLDLAGFDQSLVGVIKGGSAATIGNSSTTTDSTLTLTGTLTYAGTIVDVVSPGSRKVNLIKSIGGTATLSGANTYTGATTVSGGMLDVSGSLSGTTAVAVNSGGTLLLSGASGEQVNNGASVGLGGGTLAFNNAANQIETLGALTLSVNSTLDFGASGGHDTLLFAGIGTHAVGTTLTINNWVGNVAGGINGTDDRLVFSGAFTDFTSAFNQADVSFGGFGSGYAAIDFGGTSYEIVPVPEPSTVFAAFGLLGLVGWRERRKAGLAQRAQRAACA